MSRLKAARVQVDERALALARLGEDGAREARPRFRTVGAAATWYFATQRRLGAPKTGLAATTELLALGCHVDGGAGSVIEADLVLAADVAACLPVPQGPPGPGAAWRAWVVFVACLRDGHDVAGAAGKVRDLLDAPCDWREARELLLASVRGFARGLRRKELLG